MNPSLISQALKPPSSLVAPELLEIISRMAENPRLKAELYLNASKKNFPHAIAHAVTFFEKNFPRCEIHSLNEELKQVRFVLGEDIIQVN
jgi:glycerol-3-phosphate O-acyltransferase